MHISQPRSVIGYGHWGQFEGWSGAPGFLSDLIARHRPATVLEAGSGANPTLGEEAAELGIRYITTDVEHAELGKAAAGCEPRVLDLEGEAMPADLLGTCDLVFSRMVNEHVRAGERYHRNIRALLRPGGVAAHCFATLYALPFTLNAVLPDRISGLLLSRLAPRDEHQNGKFRAHYSWCRGPSPQMVRRFEGIGYDVLRYDGYFGHGYYRRIGPLHRAVQVAGRKLARHPVPQICSYATVVLRRRD